MSTQIETPPQAGVPGGAPPPAAAPGQPGGQPAVPDAAALQRQIDELKGQVGEKDRALQFWHDKATARPAEKPAEKPAEEDVDLLELITTKGPKGFDEYLARRGLVKADQVEQMVNTKAQQIAKESELIERYPELRKHDSDFFKDVAAEYGNLKKNGVPESVAMEAAAERVDLRYLRTGKTKTPQQQADESKADRERRRLERINAQASDRGGRAPEPADEEDDTITPSEDRIIRGMLVGQTGKDGKPMNYEAAVEAFKARAKGGVNMSRGKR